MGSFPGVKWLRLEADDSFLSSVEVKNGGANAYTPPYILVRFCLTK
jgi:hypothetical protein